MKQVQRLKKFLAGALFFCLFTITTVKAELMQGDAGQEASETFTFSVRDYVLNSNGSAFYVGAHPSSTTSSEQYAISVVSRNKNIFTPLAPQEAIINYQETSANPLFDNKIAFLKLLGTYPLVVPADDLGTIYLFDRIKVEVDEKLEERKEKAVMLSLTDIKDASNINITAGIEKIATAQNTVFAAIKPNGGAFGDANGGITTIIYGKVSKVEGDSQVVRDFLTQQAVTSLDKTTAALKIVSNLAALTINDMCWDPTFKRLYLAFDVTAGANIGDGARAVLVAGMDSNGILTYFPFAPDAAFVSNDEIVVSNPVKFY